MHTCKHTHSACLSKLGQAEYEQASCAHRLSLTRLMSKLDVCTDAAAHDSTHPLIRAQVYISSRTGLTHTHTHSQKKNKQVAAERTPTTATHKEQEEEEEEACRARLGQQQLLPLLQ
jgi:hypothetical protein